MFPQFTPLFIALEPYGFERVCQFFCMRDTACFDADLIIDRRRQVSRRGTTHIQQAADGLRLARVVGLMSLQLASHVFFTTGSLRNMGLGSLADITTLGLAISLVTSASVSSSSCFLVFFCIRHDATRANRLQFNSDHVWPLGFLFVKLTDWWETVPNGTRTGVALEPRICGMGMRGMRLDHFQPSLLVF
jgi:hypothetical protein